MTKYDPDIICPGCRDFDYAMNHQGGVSHDVFVVCECDWKPWYETEEGKKQLLDIINEKYAFMKDGTIIPREEWENDQLIKSMHNS